MKHFTLKEIERQFNVPVRKITFLIRHGQVQPVLREGHILIPESEIKRYLSLPEEILRKHHVSYLKTLGPGIVTAAADDDDSGILTYTQVGTRYGMGLAWLAVYLLPMMTAVQETVARIGIVTGKGLSGAVGKHYGRKWLYPLVLMLFIANTINNGANIGAMVASLQLLVPLNFYLGAIGVTFLMLLLEIGFSYHKYAKILKWLAASLLGYIITAIIVQPDWYEVIRSIAIPHITLEAGFITAMVAVMGTTISPYLFFWQASEEVEEKKDKGLLSDHRSLIVGREIKEMRKDTALGMTYANIVFLSIVITATYVFYKNGITNIESAEQAALALRPIAGNWAYLLFTLGIFGVGLLSVPVLAGSSAYGIAELFKWHEGLSKRYTQARGFYAVIIVSMIVGLLMNLAGIDPIRALYGAAVVNGVVAPILLFFIFRIGRDKKIMGEFVSPRWVNIWGTAATVVMGTAALTMIILAIL